MNWLARELSATDLGAAPPGHRWVWSDLGRKWVLVADRAAPPAASQPVRQTDLGPFDMPVRRNPTLSADRPAVVAAENVIRSIRGAKP